MIEDDDSQQEKEDKDTVDEETNTIDAHQLEELLITAGVTATNNPDGSVSVTVDLESIKNTSQSNRFDEMMQNIMNDIAQNISKALIANNVALFLSMYLATDKFIKDRRTIIDLSDILKFFEDNAEIFRKQITKGLNPDDSEDLETPEEIAQRESKFKTFVRACNYHNLNDLYNNHNNTLIHAVRQIQNKSLDEVTDILRSNQQLQTFLNLLEACFPEYATTQAQTHEEINAEDLEFDADGYVLNQNTTTQAKVFEITDILIEVLQEFFNQLVQKPPILHLAEAQASSRDEEPDYADSARSTTHNIKRPRI